LWPVSGKDPGLDQEGAAARWLLEFHGGVFADGPNLGQEGRLSTYYSSAAEWAFPVRRSTNRRHEEVLVMAEEDSIVRCGRSATMLHILPTGEEARAACGGGGPPASGGTLQRRDRPWRCYCICSMQQSRGDVGLFVCRWIRWWRSLIGLSTLVEAVVWTRVCSKLG
jgi:hypothetical protein